MATTNGGNDLPVGMQRLSCLPCRRRKSKCDRVQPCSSCVLRSTEKFCYTSASVDAIKPVSGSEKRKSASIPGSSPSTSNGAQRAVKAKKAADVADSQREQQPDARMDAPDRASILSAISSMKGILRGLEAQLGHVDNHDRQAAGTVPISFKVEWDDVKAGLPSKAECDIILDCFLTEATWICVSVHPPTFRKGWQAFVDGKPSSRLFVATAIFFVAIGLYMAPSSHPAHRIPNVQDHKALVIFGYTILNPVANPFITLPETTERMQAQLMMCFYMSMTGWLTPGYQSQGVLLRYARAIHLFDEDKWDLAKMSDWEIELRRRLAHNAKLGERWFSLFHLRLPVQPLVTNNKDPDFYADDEYDVDTGMLVGPRTNRLQAATYQLASAECAQGAHRTTHYLYNFAKWSQSERYAAAREVDFHLQQSEDRCAAGPLNYSQACNLGALTSPGAYKLASQALITFTSLKRLRCTVMRQFLLDAEAPVEMRVAALEHAKGIIETVPVLIAISSSPWIAFNTSWCSSHLFCAASTFALVYLSEGEQSAVSAEMDWFASKIFEVIDTLSILGAKDRIAKQCEELLIALCTSRGTLKDKHASSKTGMRQRRWSGDEAKQSACSKNGQGDGNSTDAFQSPWAPVCDAMASDIRTKELLGDMHDSTIIRVGKGSQASTAQNDASRQQQKPSSSASPSLLKSQTSGSRTFASSPEQVAANTPAAYSSDSRASISEDLSEQNGGGNTAMWPALNDSQWNTLISSLDGDWSSMFGAMQNTTLSAASMPQNGGNMIDFSSQYPDSQWNLGGAFPSGPFA